MRGAIKGMMEALGDEHSSYLDPEMFERFNAVLQGAEYEGIGAWVDTTQGIFDDHQPHARFSGRESRT